MNDDVRLAEHDEQVARAGGLELVGHAQVLVHPRLEHGERAEIEPRVVDFRREGKAADDERVEQVRGLARGAAHEIIADRIVFRPDADGGALALALLLIAALELDQAGARRERLEPFEFQRLALLGVLHAGGFEVFIDDLREVGDDRAASCRHGRA